MLYGEFLAGTQQPDNKWTYTEYKRIEKIYNNNDRMTKEEAYQMYREPDEIVKELLDQVSTYKAEAICERIESRTAREKVDTLTGEVKEARTRILILEAELNRYKRAAHDLYYATGTI